MAYDGERHHRRSIRLPGYDYAQVGAYFVTLVTAGRQCLFGEVANATVQLSPLGKVAEACWQAIPEHFAAVDLGAWVIMPNHVHGIIVIGAHGGVDGGGVGGVGAQHAAPLPDAPLRGAPLSQRGDVPTPRRVAPGSLGAIVRSFKAAVTKQGREMAGVAGVSVWQRNYYEHIIRDARELEQIQRYINDNPQRWDLDGENPTHKRAGAGR